MHFKIEELLIGGELNLDELPNFWDSKMQEYLAIKPRSFSEGCLQDINYSGGNSLGYFSAYTNGAIVASMVMKTVKEMHKNVEDDYFKR